MTEKLLPCPFCGSEAAECDIKQPFANGWVGCQRCRCFMDFVKNGKPLAIAAWNRRADAAPVVRGEWTTNSDYPDTVICSLCGWRESVWWADKGTNYCPNCGAKMRGD